MGFSTRPETLRDIHAINHLNTAAFGQSGEADLVDSLRSNCCECRSLVAENEQEIVGHIFFSPVKVEMGTEIIEGMALGPLAVLPSFQGQGIGSLLVEEGLATLEKESCPFVILVGHPGYYPQFGFVPAARHQLVCPWPGIPDEAFMVRVLEPAALEGVSGVVHYQPEFNSLL